MIECPVSHLALPRLFDPHVPNHPALWAVLDGRHAGQAVVDHLEQPKQCLLHTNALLTYASSGVNQDFLEKAIDYFRSIDNIWLVRNLGDPLAPTGYKILPRLEFYAYDRHATHLKALRNQLPSGFAIRRIDMELLQHCEWRDDMAFYCDSLENFLLHDYGICLMRGEEIITEAYASALGLAYAEIGVYTHVPYRGNGYAAITVAYLMEALEQIGYHAYWSCDLDNPASARVARKLGFGVERAYEIWEYKVKD